MMCYIMKCEWLKNESNYFVICCKIICNKLQNKYFRHSNRLSYQAMSSTCTRSHLCTATPISFFVQCPNIYIYIYISIYIYI